MVLSWFFYMKRPDIPAAIQQRFSGLYKLLDNKYYMDAFNQAGDRTRCALLGTGLWKGGDQGLIDGLFVNGSARVVGCRSLPPAATCSPATSTITHSR